MLLDQSSVLMLRERHKIPSGITFIITRGQTEISSHIQCHTMSHCTIIGKNIKKIRLHYWTKISQKHVLYEPTNILILLGACNKQKS